MAEQTIAPSSGWRKVRRRGSVNLTAEAFVTVRSNGDIGLGSDFVRLAKIEDCTRVSLYFSSDGLSLAMSFHSDEKDFDAFAVSQDGGKRASARTGYPGRVIQSSALRRESSRVSSLLKEGRQARRFIPKRDPHGLWVIHLAPCFEKIFDGLLSSIEGQSGIYRYLCGSAVVYIGRGNFSSRFSQPERKAWDFDRIEYSVLNDERRESQWESFWLRQYRDENNRLPKYNRVSGAIDVVSQCSKELTHSG